MNSFVAGVALLLIAAFGPQYGLTHGFQTLFIWLGIIVLLFGDD